MMATSWAEAQIAYEQAVDWFLRTIPDANGPWDGHALGQWSVRDLVGHTSRALSTLESYVNKPVRTIEVDSGVEYFRRALAALADPEAVAQRGQDAGAALGADPGAAVAAIAKRVLALVHASTADTVAATPVGGMRLIDYLPTRTFELTVHTCDLATALGQPLTVPECAGAQSLSLVSALATEAGLSGALLLAATGRGPLRKGFTVL
nr:maleylpyruvate isomerase N-terminal domain-containing protein [Arthrobacter polaris]UIK89164.1 maleylpyruvate isomerase N-terminal domain-containing protein [Arthrobacter polaris]